MTQTQETGHNPVRDALLRHLTETGSGIAVELGPDGKLSPDAHARLKEHIRSFILERDETGEGIPRPDGMAIDDAVEQVTETLIANMASPGRLAALQAETVLAILVQARDILADMPRALSQYAKLQYAERRNGHDSFKLGQCVGAVTIAHSSLEGAAELLHDMTCPCKDGKHGKGDQATPEAQPAEPAPEGT